MTSNDIVAIIKSLAQYKEQLKASDFNVDNATSWIDSSIKELYIILGQAHYQGK